MSAVLPPIFLGIVFAIIAFIIFVIAALAIYTRGEVVRVYADVVSYFRMKEDRFLRLRIHKSLIQTLTPDLINIFDELIFSSTDKKICPVCKKTVVPKQVDTAGGKRYQCSCNFTAKLKGFMNFFVKRDDIEEDLFDWWKKAREDPSIFKIWCYRFNRPWRYLGIKGRTVYAYCLFSLEEMIKKRGRHKEIDGLFQESPTFVYDPSVEKWTQRQIAKSKFKLDDEQLKNIVKSFKFWGEESYIATIFTPTRLSISEKSALKGRLRDFDNRFLSVLLGYRVFGAKLPKFEIYKQAFENMVEAGRLFNLELHTLKDVIGHGSQQYGRLETINKLMRVPVKINPTYEPLPIGFQHPKEKGKTFAVKKAVKEAVSSPFEFMNMFMILLGTAFSILAFGGSMFNVTNWGIFLIAVMFLFSSVGLLYLRKRNEPVIKKPEPKKEVESSNE